MAATLVRLVLLTALVALGVLAFARSPLGEPLAQLVLPQDRAAPPVDATGLRGSYVFAATQPGNRDDPVTYNPCEPIRVVTNPDGAPPGGQSLLEEALDRVAAATGLRLELRGQPTDERPTDDRPVQDAARYGQGYSPVLVAWSDPDETPGLAGPVAGLGGSSSVLVESAGRRVWVSGQIALDADDARRTLAGRGGADHVRAVLMHELGHVVGLAHSPDPSQLMAARNTGRTTFNDGDRAGLARLGRGPCVG